MQQELLSAQQAQQRLSAELSEAQAALSEQQDSAQSQLAQAQRELSQEQGRCKQQQQQLAQLVEAQRRLGQELQEGEEAQEQAEASRAQAQVGKPRAVNSTDLYIDSSERQRHPACHMHVSRVLATYTMGAKSWRHLQAWLQLRAGQHLMASLLQPAPEVLLPLASLNACLFAAGTC